MHARFGREQPERKVPLHNRRRALQAGLIAWLIVDDFALEAAALDPSQVHAQQHLGPVLRLGAAGARMNRDDGVLAIVLAAEHLLDLAAFDEAGQLLDARGQLRRDIFSLTRPVDEHVEIVCSGCERRDQLDLFLDSPAALKDFLRLDLVVPEIGCRCAGFYLCELITRASGLKDNSGGRRRASRGPGTGGSNHRERTPRMPPVKSSATSVSAAQMYANRSPILP